MVTPERLVPGIKASACATPMINARPKRHVLDGPLLRTDHVGDQHENAVEDRVPGDDGDVALEIGIAELLEDDAEGDGRDGGEHDIDGELALLGDLALEQLERAAGDVPDVAPEIDENGQQRAEMRQDIGELALVGPMHQLGDQDQVARGGDRQELRDPLHYGKHDDLL